ncbi:MAG TPA: hypothetical protein VFL64_00565 [Rhizobacter sp.]|nr:hypothetical protein [Rhizobacter sp.]
MSSPRPRIAASLLLVAAGLSACYVVPIDPKTGQGYPISYDNRGTSSQPGTVTVVTPPTPAGPPQPSVLNARLYPLNTQANKGGLITATVVDNNAGRGTFTLSYLGDTLQGEATRVDANYAFGRVYNEVLGLNQRSFSGRRGIANAYGGKGVSAQCEYLITGPAMGTGACQFSDGAKYQMHFGS